MSLKSFHILFILLSIAFCGWFGYWQMSERGDLVVAAAAWCAGLGLIIYLFMVMKKFRSLKAL
jgi:hypothetical protein